MSTPLFLKMIMESGMKEKIQELFFNVRNLTAIYMIGKEHDNVKTMQKYMPQLQEFVLWFLQGNQFGIEEELYQGMSQNLLYILQDIVDASENNDQVLLNDALAYGLMEYLELFLGKGEQTDDAV